MSVELGSIGSAIGNAAGALGRAGAGVIEGGAAPAPSISSFGGVRVVELKGLGPAGLSNPPDVGGVIGSVEEFKASLPVNIFGAKLTVPTEPILAEGPAHLEDIMPKQTKVFKPIGEIRFIPQELPEVSAPVVFPQVEPRVEPIAIPNGREFATPQIVTSSSLEEEIEAESAVSTQAATQTKAKNMVSAQVALQEQTEEQISTAHDQDDKVEAEESEDVSESKIKLVEAEKVSHKRRKRIKEAVKKAKEENITIAQALPGGFWEDKSPIVGDGKDWTLDLTAQALEINPNQYTSIKEVEEVSVATVAENIPVERGEGTRQATVSEVRKVKYGEEDLPKQKTPAQIVTRRIIKKKVESNKNGAILRILEDKAETTSGITLKDLGLEELFQKAA